MTEFTREELSMILAALQDATESKVLFKVAPEKFREMQRLAKRIFDHLNTSTPV